MGEAVLHEGAPRSALAIGLSLDSPHESDLLVLGQLDPLFEAPSHAASVSNVLTGFGYAEGWHPSSAADPGEEIRKAVTCGDTEVLVVHVVAHGRLAKAGARELHVVGSDGRDLDDPVSAWISLIESHPDKPRPWTLFILDLCHSGAAASLPWHQEMQAGSRRAWVIAACGREDKAFDYRLSRATTAVLQKYLDKSLRVDASYAYLPLHTVVREIQRAVEELSAAEGYPQQIEGSRVPFFTEHLDDLPFFPNPGYRPEEGSLSTLDADIVSLLDEAFDPRHFMLRAAGTEPLDRGMGQGYFCGRDSEVAALTDWLNGQGTGLRVVTGKRGVGKSALLGVLVCAAHPALRDASKGLWMALPVKPARNDRLAVVHARHRDLEQIADSLARQLGAAEQDHSTGSWNAPSLIELAQATPGLPFTLVIDALDEAERPDDITRALLLPLAHAARAGTSRLRLLIGTRPESHFEALIRLADDNAGLINLDQTVPMDLYQALRQYVGDLLAVETPYAACESADAAAALAEGIAARLTGVNDPTREQGDTIPLEWGEFLTAGLYLRHVLSLPVEQDPDAARELGLAAPLDLRELLELDLACDGDQMRLRPVLSALAYAEGKGMPERVLTYVAPAFVPGKPGDDPLPFADARAALARASFYLRRDVDVDGTTLYRLFQEGLAERLRAHPLG